MKVINSKKFFFSVFFLIYVVLLVLNFLTPLIADDFAYIYKTEGFHTIFHDEYLQYITQNGRSVAHILVRFFLLLPKFIFNFLNPLVFLIKRTSLPKNCLAKLRNKQKYQYYNQQESNGVPFLVRKVSHYIYKI